MKPLIGISVDSEFNPNDTRTLGSLKLNWNYAQVVVDAGGTPILIPPMADMEQIAKLIDGWIIPGGNDIDAAKFGEENHPKVELQDPRRFEGEEALFKAASPNMPILGICYGCQFLNVVRGGTLIQHLPDVVGHETHSGGTMQAYAVEDSSILASAAATKKIEGRSYHHQAVGKVGDGLKVVASGDDGTIEAIEATDHPWLVGLQWHPERTADDEATKNILKAFVQAAAAYASSK